MNQQDNWEAHWEQFAEIAAINPAQDYRRKLIFQILSTNNCAFDSIIDVGCGQGDLIAELERQFFHSKISGVELSKTGLAIAAKKILQPRLYQLDLSLPNINIPEELNEKYDIAICSEVLEHLDSPQIFLNNTKNFLKKNGKLIVTVPGGLMSEFDRHIGHRKHYTSIELKNLLEESGFKIDYILKSGFPFFNLYKIATILQGKNLEQSLKNTKMSFLAQLASKVFNILFKLNLKNSRWGWQLVAVARMN